MKQQGVTNLFGGFFAVTSKDTPQNWPQNPIGSPKEPPNTRLFSQKIWVAGSVWIGADIKLGREVASHRDGTVTRDGTGSGNGTRDDTTCGSGSGNSNRRSDGYNDGENTCCTFHCAVNYREYSWVNLGWCSLLILEQNPIIWQDFCWKPQENERNWTKRRGTYVPSDPDSPMF